MSRGWESKDVEGQQEAHEERRREAQLRKNITEAELVHAAKRESLLMDRTRLMREMEAARHERHRQMLQQALDHIEGKLAELG